MIRPAALIVAMALTTAFLRFLPFILFSSGRRPPAFITYLGSVLPPAMIAMLVVYCIRDIDFTAYPFGAPELLSAAAVILLQIYKRNSLVSILLGTVLYMFLIRFIFI